MSNRLWASLVSVLLVATAMAPSQAGQQVGEQSVYSRKVGFEQHLFYGTSGNSNGQVQYICKAYAGNGSNDNTAAAVWQVAQLTYNSSGQVTDIEFAGDDDGYNQICDNRAVLNFD